ncbi:MAG: NUDIX domain-containing protein [Bdellovibrionota bacterium]
MRGLLNKLVRFSWLFRPKIVLGTRVLAIKDGQVLLVRHTYMNDWYLPGGAVDPGETLSEAAGRELLEETGYRANSLTLRHVFLSKARGLSDHIALYETSDFAQVPDAKPDREIAEARFFGVDELPENTSPATRRRIDESRRALAPPETW